MSYFKCQHCEFGIFDHQVEGSPSPVYTCSLEEGFRPCEDTVPVVEVKIPYLRDASSNSYKIVGKGGRRTNATKPVVLRWMEQLNNIVREHPYYEDVKGKPCEVHVEGFFANERGPDVHNFEKVICDALEESLQINDKYMRFIDEGYNVGYENQHFGIWIVPVYAGK